MQVVENLDKELWIWKKTLRSNSVVQQLRSAFAHGHMENLEDAIATETASVAMGAPGLPAFVIATRLLTKYDSKLVVTLGKASDAACSAYPLTVLGNLLQKHLHKYDEAELAYRKAIEIDPTDVVPWNNLGYLLQNQLGRYDEAELIYRRAIEIDPTYPYPWNNLGRLLQNHLARYNEAELAYRTAIAFDPNDARPWTNLGDLLADHLHRYDEAEAAYQKGVELGPNDARPWTNLGDLLVDHLHRYQEAEAAYRKAIEIDPSNGCLWSSLAWARYLNTKLDTHTEDVARTAVALEPDDVNVVYTLATILAARDQWPDAEPYARRYLAEAFPEFHERTWPDTLTFFREAARTGHAADAVRLLDELGIGERWRPLREALAAIAAGSKLPLRRIAPEVRKPAEELLEQLWPQGLD
jgi:Flp pilus assembly protein TadD